VPQKNVDQDNRQQGADSGHPRGARVADGGHPRFPGKGIRPAHRGAVRRSPGAKDEIVGQRSGNKVEPKASKDLVHVATRLEQTNQQAPGGAADDAAQHRQWQ